MHPDRVIDRIASHQYGVVSLEQARSAGLTQRMVDVRLNSGAWIRLASGVYAMASAAPRWERQMAAALLSQPGSVAAGQSAAYLHEMPGFGPGRPVVANHPTANARSPLGKVVRTKYFDILQRQRIRGFETTDYADTVMMLAASTPSPVLERLIDDGLASKKVKVETLASIARSRAGAPGIRKLRTLIETRSEDAYEPTVTELERMLHRVIDHPMVPPTTRQRPFQFEEVAMTVDVYIPVWRLIIEADGRRWHTRVADFERDRRRDNHATANGYAVLRFTYRMLRDSPSECLSLIVQTGRVRAVA